MKICIPSIFIQDIPWKCNIYNKFYICAQVLFYFIKSHEGYIDGNWPAVSVKQFHVVTLLNIHSVLQNMNLNS